MGFLPSRNGLRFANAFPDGAAVIVDLGVTKLGIGNASRGLCGGMVFTALDYWTEGLPPPPDTTPPASGSALFTYLVRRSIDSWALPKGPLTYLALMNPGYPDGDAGVGPRTVHGRTWRMVKREWPAVRATLEAGRPCPLGLITVVSANPLAVGQNHQVLAYDYDLSGAELRLGVYDPNQAGRDDVVITVDLSDPSGASRMSMTAAGDPVGGVRCFFKVGYRPRRPPPVPAAG